VDDLLDDLASGMSEAERLADLPDLTRNDLRAYLACAAAQERRLASLPATCSSFSTPTLRCAEPRGSTGLMRPSCKCATPARRGRANGRPPCQPGRRGSREARGGQALGSQALGSRWGHGSVGVTALGSSVGVRLSLFRFHRGSLYPLRQTMKEPKPDPNPRARLYGHGGQHPLRRDRPGPPARGAHDSTKARRDGGGEALGCTPSEATHPPPARDAHEGTKTRRDGGANRVGVRLSLFHFHRGSLYPLRQTMKEPKPDPNPRARLYGSGGQRPLRRDRPGPPARDAHEGTKARRDGDTKRRRRG